MNPPSPPRSSSALQQYVAALESAAVAIDVARKLRPDHGLDHALDRLRVMIQDAAAALLALPDETPPA